MNFAAQIQSYGSPLETLVDPERLPELGPGTPDSTMRSTLRGLKPSDLFPDTDITDRDAAACCLSGLWLWYDFLDESHELSQTVDDTTGSFWHGIMHRREPDYSNSKYWFRRVGKHPAFTQLHRAVNELHQAAPTTVTETLAQGSEWQPMRFIDLCAQHDRTGSTEEQSCREIAKAEWFTLFDYCYRIATS